MWLLLALAVHAAGLVACLAAVRAVRRRPAGLDACLAAATFLCGQALVVHALSAMGRVGRPGLLFGDALLAGAAAGLAWLGRGRRPALPRWPRPRALLRPETLPLVLLGGALLTAALAYRPNNWDAMTYHLARVAHWLQRGSVAAYPTSIPRQLLHSPGAEYLLLGLQGIAGSDRLAGLVQLGAWALGAWAAAPLARAFGAPAGLARLAPIAAAAGPLAVQEASGTQNDLVAALTAVAAVAAALPLLHRRPRWRAGDLALLCLVVAAAALTKPTAPVVAAPFLLAALVGLVRGFGGRAGLRRAALALPAVAVAAGALVPFLRLQAASPLTRAVAEPYVYRGAGELGDRAANALRGLVRDLALPIPALDRLAPERTEGCDLPRALCLEPNRLLREDTTGSVGPALLAALIVAAGALRWRRLAPRTRLAVACLAGAWVLFHAVFRDNVWAPRLHLPFYALSPAGLGALGAAWRGRAGRALAVLAAAALLAHAAVAVAFTDRRPVRGRPLHTAGATSAYYRGSPPGVRSQHDAALAWLARTGCRRLGLYLGGDSYDYPLTWRAMQRGVEVRHLAGDDGWRPCAVFSDQGVPPGGAARWAPTELPDLWVPAPR